jgi:predicted dehydrogenase
VSERLRVGVVGGGLIAQAVHLPNLLQRAERFELVAIADPSPTVVEALAARSAPARAYADWRTMLERERLDALVVCSPHATHAEIVLAALDAGVHAFVEKPLCISVADADAICARRAETGLVVQVGYMKRYDPAYASLLDALPADARDLRFVDVVTYDPWMAREPFVPWGRMVTAQDIPAAVLEASRAAERKQVEDAVGAGDAETVRAYSYTFLACLIHDVNLVHGVLERLGVPLPAQPLAAADWAQGSGASVLQRLPNGAAWHTAWLLLRGLEEFCETVSFSFEGAIHRLRFPAPYHVQAPVVHEVVDAEDGQPRLRRRALVGDSYVAELEHFYDCVVEGVACRTPPEQGRDDIAALRDLFVAGRGGAQQAALREK